MIGIEELGLTDHTNMGTANRCSCMVRRGATAHCVAFARQCMTQSMRNQSINLVLVYDARGRAEEIFPQEVKNFVSTATLVPLQPRIQNFLPAGDFFYPNPPLPHLAHRPPPKHTPPRPALNLC